MGACKGPFLPEAFLAAPRRSPGIPNLDGSLILYSVSTYSFSTHERKTELCVLDTKTSESTLLDSSERISNPVWIDRDTVALLRADENSTTHVVIGNVHEFEKSYIAGSVAARADNLKVIKVESKRYGLALTASASPDGTLYTESSTKKRNTSARLYRSLFVRHWDKYVDRQRNSIWYAALEGTHDPDTGNAKFKMSGLVNALQNTALESPIPPFGGTDNFSISKSGIVFVSKDPLLDPATNTKCNLYYLPLVNFLETVPKLTTLNLGPIQGTITSPVFSPAGQSIAFLAMKHNGYEADKNQLFYIPDIENLTNVVHLLSSDDGYGRWDRSPSAVKFSYDGASLYLTAESAGRKGLFRLPCAGLKPDGTPVQLITEASVSDFQPIDGGSTEKVFVTRSSLVDSSIYSVLCLDLNVSCDAPDIGRLETVSSLTKNGEMFGLSRSQIREFWFPTFDSTTKQKYEVHSWMLVPSTFDESKTYPLAFLVHGGPQSAWLDAWSTRWNPALFAEQGYVVVLTNFTGSTGYGQEFTDAIQEQWGGRPYEDLANCFLELEKKSFIDTDRAVALGGSYGGYMVNWIQGHELGRKFRALVTHDGCFSLIYHLSTDEVYFNNHDLGVYTPSNHTFRKWDPARFTDQWQTPHLVIHSDLDYRLSVVDGLATFNTLQSQGIESEFLNFPDENHWVLKAENSLVWHETVFNWINKHVGLPLLTDNDNKEVVQDPPRGKTVPQEQVVTFHRS